MTSLTLLTFDVETTRKCPVGSNEASPYWPENKIVAAVAKTCDEATRELNVNHIRFIPNSQTTHLFIGHNVGFDIAYLLTKRGAANGCTVADFIHNGGLWDTQLAAYLLSGQQHKWASLDDLCREHGLPLKDNFVKDAFAAGKGADEIEYDRLIEYCKADVKNTHAIAVKQMETAENIGMTPLVLSQMDALAATIEMTYNGLAINRDYIDATCTALSTEITEIETKAKQLVSRMPPEYGGNARDASSTAPLDPFSPTQLSKLLFGGTVKEKVKERAGTYKNGKTKYKQVEKLRTIYGWTKMTADPTWIGANGLASTNDEVLQQVLTYATNSSEAHTLQLVECVLKHRELSKLLSTYFEGVRKLIMPDGFVHHKLNQTSTVTGRLSGSEPNMQNQTGRGAYSIKNAFVSRWGEHGVILEADYKQLELVALAFLTKDPTLIEDICSGKDIHTELFLSMHGRTPTTDERWWFKRCSFALVYGGGKSAIAKQGNTTLEEARRFIDTFYTRYPKVKEWHDTILAQADEESVNEGDKDTETGLPVRKFYYKSVTGRMYVFREYPNSFEVRRWKKRACSFSPTELKNYPVQGLATGDIVPMMLGVMLRVLKNNPTLADKCLMINTVHDSVVFDVHKDVLAEAIPVIQSTLESAPKQFENTFKQPFNLPLKVELSYGPSWGEQIEEV